MTRSPEADRLSKEAADIKSGAWGTDIPFEANSRSQGTGALVWRRAEVLTRSLARGVPSLRSSFFLLFLLSCVVSVFVLSCLFALCFFCLPSGCSHFALLLSGGRFSVGCRPARGENNPHSCPSGFKRTAPKVGPRANLWP